MNLLDAQTEMTALRATLAGCAAAVAAAQYLDKPVPEEVGTIAAAARERGRDLQRRLQAER